MARTLCEISKEINRQVALLIDRRGRIRVAVVGDARSVYLPDLTAYREGHTRLCGLRLIHTHLHPDGLNDDDLTDLALLRLDLIAAIEVDEAGLPRVVHTAHLLAANDEARPWRIYPPVPIHELADDFASAVGALEAEFARTRAPRHATNRQGQAILIHVSTETATASDESMTELRELARSGGIQVLEELMQRRPVDPKFVLGKGRLQGAIIRAMQLGAETLIFDLNLTPAQVKNIADFTDLKVLDRTQVILDIFAQRAQEREGKVQVELAQLRYLLPRLSAKHTAMSRLTGGIGGRGPGETKLEINQRRAQQRITLLQRELKKLGDRRKLRRKRRTDRGVPMVSIVGYTNAGKSTLLNRLTQSEVPAENELFATLNPASRRLRLPKEREIIVTDTVGFIRKLPATLMAAFRTTFEEIDPADLLLLVLDASSPEIDNHHQTVVGLLSELELQGKPTIVVLNKADRCDAATMRALKNKYGGIALSALNPDTFGELHGAIEAHLWDRTPLTPLTSDAGETPAQQDAI